MTALNKQALREAAERAESDSWGYDRDEFNEALTPSTVLALLDELEAAEKRIAELEAKIETADKLQDSAFRHGLQHGFSYGQTNDQAGYEQCLKSYSSRGKDNG